MAAGELLVATGADGAVMVIGWVRTFEVPAGPEPWYVKLVLPQAPAAAV